MAGGVWLTRKCVQGEEKGQASMSCQVVGEGQFLLYSRHPDWGVVSKINQSWTEIEAGKIDFIQ